MLVLARILTLGQGRRACIRSGPDCDALCHHMMSPLNCYVAVLVKRCFEQGKALPRATLHQCGIAVAVHLPSLLLTLPIQLPGLLGLLSVFWVDNGSRA